MPSTPSEDSEQQPMGTTQPEAVEHSLDQCFMPLAGMMKVASHLESSEQNPPHQVVVPPLRLPGTQQQQQRYLDLALPLPPDVSSLLERVPSDSASDSESGQPTGGSERKPEPAPVKKKARKPAATASKGRKGPTAKAASKKKRKVAREGPPQQPKCKPAQPPSRSVPSKGNGVVHKDVLSDKQLAAAGLQREKQERQRAAAAAQKQKSVDAIPGSGGPFANYLPSSPRKFQQRHAAGARQFSEKDESLAKLLGLAGMKPQPRGPVEIQSPGTFLTRDGGTRPSLEPLW